MLKNYIKTAVRNIVRNKIFSTINIAGLSIGILSSILITLYVIDELSYDSFFSNADRIYRLAYETEASVGQRNHYPSIGGGVGEQLKIDFPEIVSVVRIFKNTAGGTTWLVKDNERFREDNFFFADSSLFDVLDYEFLKGNPDNAFRVPNSLVITEAIEKKYFGSEDSINRTLGFELPNGTLIDLKVTGVLKDLPDNTHFHFDFLFPMSSVGNLFPGAPPRAIQNFLSNWQFTAFYTYFLAPENFDAELFEEKLPAFLNNHTTTRQREFIKGIYTQKLTDIHLRSNYLLNEIEPNSDIMYVYIFAAIAVMTIIVACINFMNLSTAKSANRAKEVGLRKVSGADRPDIIRQFLGESSLIAFIALIIAVIIVTISLPAFNGISGKEFDLGFLGDPVLITGLVVMTLFVGVLAGSYPAFFLSSFNPTDTLKGNLRTGAKSGLLRKILVISQFSISIFFIIGSMIVHSQLDYFRNKDLGFDKNNLMIVRLFLTGNNQEDFVNTIRVLKNEIQNHREVKFVSSSIGVPGGLRPIVQYRNPEDPGSQYQYLAQVPIDYNYIPAMNIQLKDGRNFSRDFITDNASAVILNEVSVEKLGLSEPVVGKTVDVLQGGLNGSAVKRTVIGVIKNMNYEPLRRKTEPMALVLAPDGGGSLLIKITGENIPETIEFARSTWQKIVPDRPFEYSFLDEDLSNLYIAEANFSHATNSFTILAIIIAGLGLFGLASFTAEQRTKEIGIRKVMGAPVGRIMFLLTREFFYLVMISNIFAWPLAYYFASKWIQNFAFHISLSPAPFFLSGVLALAIAVLTVGGQAFKAAMINPAKSLRYE